MRAARAAERPANGANMAILTLDHVVKRFGDFTAVDDLSIAGGAAGERC